MRLLARYSLMDGELPPTLIEALWHSGFSQSRNPFALCYGRGDTHACDYLRQFGQTREEQARNYYLWSQTVPLPFWRYFELFNLTKFAEVVADMVPPLAIANLIRTMDWYYHFKNATVIDLFSGVCGWLMAFAYAPSHYVPKRWIAVDVDAKRLQICKLVGRELGVDVATVRRDLSRPFADIKAEVVVGSPPCHEFTATKVSARRYIANGLRLVASFLESAKTMRPVLAVMEESVSAKDAVKKVAGLVGAYGFRYMIVPLRKFGAIQYARERLIAWRTPDARQKPKDPDPGPFILGLES